MRGQLDYDKLMDDRLSMLMEPNHKVLKAAKEVSDLRVQNIITDFEFRIELAQNAVQVLSASLSEKLSQPWPFRSTRVTKEMEKLLANRKGALKSLQHSLAIIKRISNLKQHTNENPTSASESLDRQQR